MGLASQRQVRAATIYYTRVVWRLCLREVWLYGHEQATMIGPSRHNRATLRADPGFV